MVTLVLRAPQPSGGWRSDESGACGKWRAAPSEFVPFLETTGDFAREYRGTGGVIIKLRSVTGEQMPSIRAWIAVSVALCSFGVSPRAAAQGTTGQFRVEEEKMRFHLLPQAGLELPVLNSAAKSISGNFTVALLHDENEVVVASRSGTFIAKPGETVQQLDWPAAQLPTDSPSELGWYRLRYSFVPADDTEVAETRGIVQLGPILVDGFGVSVAGASKVAPGSQYPVRVHVENALTGQPLANIVVELVLEIGDNEYTDIKRSVETNGSGDATVTFKMPEKPSEDQGEITATVKRGSFTEESTLDFAFPEKPAPALTITTDKPLYQPGQTVHVRLFALNSDKRAMTGAKLDLTIEDEDGSELFHQKLTSSRFGIASADWDIPKKLQLGQATVTAKFDDPETNNYWTQRRSEIRISRYELPNFTVKVDPDRTYYLPGRDAVLDVYAEYLFGKPVHNGKVRIVRQEGRHWDYAKQKWEADESAPVEGELGADGHFKGTVKLGDDFKALQDDSSELFSDLTLAAYLTDSSTGRTEQRRFKLRISGQPIHVYRIDSGTTFRGRPSIVYITSSYADGQPAETEGEVYAAQPTNDETAKNGFDLAHRRLVGTFRTNHFGIGRMEISPLQEADLRIPMGYSRRRAYDYGYGFDYGLASDSDEPRERIAWLIFEAHDGKGLTGKQDDQIAVETPGDFLEMKTDHTLYHPGDAIHATLRSSLKDGDVVLNVQNSQGLLSSQVVALRGGQATATVAYEPRLSGDVLLTASSMTPNGEQQTALSGWTKILFPARKELGVAVKMERTTFKPGERVSADVSVVRPDGHATESALGLLVFDRAVAERVRTDEEFGRDYGYSIFDYFDWEYQQSIGGVSYRDLLGLEANKPFPDGLDLVAEGMIHTVPGPWEVADSLEGGGWDGRGASGVFGKWIEAEMAPATKALNDWQKANGEYPGDEAGVRAALQAKGIDFDELHDPWGMPLRVKYSFRRSQKILEFVSSGIDKKPGSGDDFAVATFHWPYFRKLGRQIDSASNTYFQTTGKYIRDFATLREELKKQGVDLDSLRDPWGHAYSFSFDISGTSFRILADSAGRDGIFDSKTQPSWDDVEVWVSSIYYFIAENAALNAALADTFKASGSFPQNEEQLKPVLVKANIDPAHFLDPWGNPYRFTFSEKSRYADQLVVRDMRAYSDPAKPTKKVTEAIPVTQQVAYLNVLSNGPQNDPAAGFSVAEFSRVVAEQSSKDREPVPTAGKQKPLAGNTGGIYGVVTDPSGGAVAGATVQAISLETSLTLTTQADFAGAYAFTNLPVGPYQIECKVEGFNRSVVQRVPVQYGFSTEVNLTLNVGAASQTVEVSADIAAVQTESATVSSVRSVAAQGKPLFTPRLRKYFPETLVWRPEVITDKKGRAHIDFPMADNITSWKMSVLASTEAGEVGIAEKELQSFQPFFLENDPPKVLTEGDQISLPVVLRNYTAQAQTVYAEMQPAPWFSILSTAKQSVSVPANGEASSVFTFRADQSAREAHQRVTARNHAAGDAVESTLSVHPDGEEIAFTNSRVLAGGRSSIEVQVPDNAIAGSADAELRIYPNLLAHVLDAMNGIGKLPTGCAEQITSTSYVSLMALQLLQKGAPEKPDAANQRSALAAQARAALQEGYDQLSSLQNADGGFAYWKSKPTDLALTAYALRFLNEASALIEVDGAIRRRARDYLVSRQAASGAWTSKRWADEPEIDDANLTAYIARALAGTKPLAEDKDPEKQKRAQAALKSALDFLEARIDFWSDPYLAGNYAIAAIESAHPGHIENATAVLRRLAHREGDATYWNLETNTTLFYGWGMGGRLETTGLAVKALTMLQAMHPDRDTEEMISRGLQYLLGHKDRYALWYSTQATQNVLEAVIAALPAETETGTASAATLRVNGRAVRSIPLPSPEEAVGPVTVPLSQGLEKGVNKIEIVRSGSSGAVNASVVASYYVPWGDSEATTSEARKTGDSRALQFKALYDHNEIRQGDRVHCTVTAERIGFRGYGMMLAEVGLPPGAEVDRASLEEAENSGAASGYEIQPDRVVFYVWPAAGGTTWSFDFRMRYRSSAMTAASRLYDYYNPDANATVAPVRFTVR
jgi:A-macroglobulin complement component/alpha-2-macroglobulin family protein/MG2 domain-containing protein/carboxypeptidase family protein/A-macroglobulin receptor/macroglobulin-like protein